MMGHIMQVSEKTLLADIERRLVDEFPYVSPMVVQTPVLAWKIRNVRVCQD